MNIIIETNRLLIREYSADDITPLHIILSDQITMSFWPKPFTFVQTQSWLERSLKSYREIEF